MIDKMHEVSEVFGIKIHTRKAANANEIENATRDLINKKTNAIFVNNDNNALAEFEIITQIANKHNMPVFVSDLDCLDKGALAVLGPDQYEIGQQAGEIANRILLGEFPGKIPVEAPREVTKNINSAVAEQFEVIYKQSSYEKYPL
jgi:putative ABC transport system substrate-binding protein